MRPKPLIAGNWKMNGRLSALAELKAIADDAARYAECDLLICPPATLLSAAYGLLGQVAATGGQDCHAEEEGAHTGDISAFMLKDVGASYVIVGHSERRGDHGESDADVQMKAQAALSAGLTPIVCCGETKEQREAGEAESVISKQLDGSLPSGVSPSSVVVAYEPIWAIGSGKSATSADIATMHERIRERLRSRYGAEDGERIRILYGGSVKPDNAREILAIDNVDGALIGGASLKAEDFLAICESSPKGIAAGASTTE